MRNCLLLILGLTAAALFADEKDDALLKEKQTANRKTVEELNSANKAKHDGKDGFLVLPGLLADRKEQKVTILAESTTIKPKDIIEFFLIGEASGHDYEAIALSFAKPSDIRNALEFIGMEPGHCVSFKDNRFWPKGERVKIRIALHSKPDNLVPVERYIADIRTGKPLPEDGFAFTGSLMVKNSDGQEVLAADSREPQSIASNYNEPETLLDIPRQGSQDELYDRLHANPDLTLPPSELLYAVIEPEYKDGARRISELTLTAKPDSNASDSITNDIFIVTDTTGTVLNKEQSLKSALDIFNRLNKDKKDVYVSFIISDDLTARNAQQTCQLLQSLEASGNIRIEPPQAGQLYYRAFAPNPAHLDRSKRPGHPWELRLTESNKGISGILTQCEFNWDEQKDGNPAVTSQDFEIASPDALVETIRKNGDARKASGKDTNIPVILVVAPPDMTFAEIMNFIRPAMELLTVVHVYAGEPEK